MKREVIRHYLMRGVNALRDRRGNVTMTFALALIPLIGGLGAAVDYSRANSARTAMQAALGYAAGPELIHRDNLVLS